MADMTVANTILAQMGGPGRLKAFIGAGPFYGDDKSVMFAFKGSRKANKCRVTLEWDDTYKMELFKMRNGALDYDVVYEETGLYFDMLKPTFEQETGLYLSL